MVVKQTYGGKDDQGQVELFRTINLTTADNVNVACHTQNSDGTCRVKILEINVNDRAMRTYFMLFENDFSFVAMR